MAAGLSRKQINDRKRRWLQREARENNGTYSKYRASGTTDTGISWSAYIRMMYASNGECAGVLEIEINGKPVPYEYVFGRSVKDALAAHCSKCGADEPKAMHDVLGHRPKLSA